MLPKNHVISHVDHVHDVVGVVFSEEIEDLKFDASLVLVLLFVLYYFNADMFFQLMVETFKGLLLK